MSKLLHIDPLQPFMKPEYELNPSNEAYRHPPHIHGLFLHLQAKHIVLGGLTGLNLPKEAFNFHRVAQKFQSTGIMADFLTKMANHKTVHSESLFVDPRQVEIPAGPQWMQRRREALKEHPMSTRTTKQRLHGL